MLRSFFYENTICNTEIKVFVPLKPTEVSDFSRDFAAALYLCGNIALKIDAYSQTKQKTERLTVPFLYRLGLRRGIVNCSVLGN